MTKKAIREAAKRVKNDRLSKRVINDQLSKLNEMTGKEFINSLKNYEYSCQAGCVSMLIYYNDTERFYNRYSDLIEELALEYDYSIDKKEGLDQYKNNMAWFAYETIVSEFVGELGL